MSTYITTDSIQETVAAMANSIANSVNSAVSDIAGVDVFWFRLLPDKRNQDVIFQSYTLYGVEDCPLKFKAMYSDTGYDDAAITYNIMGLEYAIPMTLDIACDTWYTVTDQDGTLPQRGDIVFIPISNKLLEVVSMTPVKAIGAQVTSYKCNLSIYKPSRNRIVGENLKESIENNTVNLNSQFGTDIENTLKNIVDNSQIGINDSTEHDPNKDLTKQTDPDTGRKTVESIITEDLVIDGHIVARTHYNMNSSDIIVKYKKSDTVTSIDSRCLSFWLNINETNSDYKNIQNIVVSSDLKTLTLTATSNYPVGTKIVIERGRTIIMGEVTSQSPFIVTVNPADIKNLNRMNPSWYQIPGFIVKKDKIVNLLSATGTDTLEITLHNNSNIQLAFNDKTVSYQLTSILDCNKWYGIVINLSDSVYIDVYCMDGKLTRIVSMAGLNNKLWNDYSYDYYYLRGSAAYMTNIRYYDCENIEIDKQITDLVTYTISDDSHAIINDSADVYLNKQYVGIQR